jgi:DsbC/DsbD-like thiol-disulfide interchange protein
MLNSTSKLLALTLAMMAAAPHLSCPAAPLALKGLTLELVCEQDALVPGKPLSLGLMIHHEPGYHTYWKQPGIVGVPTALRWDLPKGFMAGDLLYPGPEITHMFQIRAQGFERPVLLQTLITVPKEARIGDRITLRAQASWMCCAKTCHPGQAMLSVTLPVRDRAAPDPQWQPIFEQERSRFARTSTQWQSQATQRGQRVELTLKPLGPLARPLAKSDLEGLHFFTLDGWINTDTPQELILNPEGGITIRLLVSEVFLGGQTPKSLNGIVGREGAGWLRDKNLRCLIVTPKLSRQTTQAGS